MPDSPIAVVGAVIVRDGLVFAARRSPERSAGGLWEFPGGKVDPGETPKQALAREIREELAVTVEVGQRAARCTTPVGNALIDLDCYWATLVGDAPSSSTDHDALAWIAPADLLERKWSPADVPIVQAAFLELDRAW
ncbi:(deoxy)nucleoside triphosphate pyrophosphohydrolase [Brachybacterium sp. MASK1Z-5]|uniref:8-oxo-dGTP diphosphatase n=1 Tax=Brachybacterium halotolerans TaxID=2795215 RepID=A0ABS1B7G5_9MICO|nr:(deoxy)nucleoside triphosphate pyrophosphohydrolase [Brachybacterium halotolerans]MBK0330587.1 (deoxy)nucleoside triphosphate pyrophosphohydrolase [Brachybacterium halotolerans]